MQAILVRLIVVTGLCTPLTLANQPIGAPFKVYAIVIFVTGSFGFVQALIVSCKQFRQIQYNDAAVLTLVLFLGVLTAILVLVIHVQYVDDY